MAEEKKNQNSISTVFKVGAISLAFLIIGYQTSLFIHRAAVLRIKSNRDEPDTVYVIDEALARKLLAGSAEATSSPGLPDGRKSDRSDGKKSGPPAPRYGESGVGQGGKTVIRKNATHDSTVVKVREETRKVETFRFNPNTVSFEDLRRLGFSEKQADAIIHYREKGGRYRRKSDFARSFVVADSVYKRLEKSIVIPKIDINLADSAAFDTLPGIGGWFAAKMVSYREELGGYSFPEQLMDIYHFDEEKYRGLSDLISCSPPDREFALWSLPAEELRKHPYIRRWQTAKSIVFFRENNPKENWTVSGLIEAGILDPETGGKLSRCRIAGP